MERQSGTTTNQMKSAAQNALYVWCNQYLNYPKALARHLRREDLQIVPPCHLDIPDAIRGLRRDVVIDHAAALTHRQMDVYGEYLRYRETLT